MHSVSVAMARESQTFIPVGFMTSDIPHPSHWRWLLLLFLLVAGFPNAVQADDAADDVPVTEIKIGIDGVQVSTTPQPQFQLDKLQIGYNGLFKVGCWTRLDFALTGPPNAIVRPVVTAPDPDGNPVDSQGIEVTLSPAGNAQVSHMIRLGRLGAALRIQVEHAGTQQTLRVVHTAGTSVDSHDHVIRSLPQHQQLWLIQGDQPAFENAARRWNRMRPDALSLVNVDDLQLLDAEPSEGLDAVVLGADAVVTITQSQTLDLWVQRGGRLVIPVGGAVAQLKASPLAGWLPCLPNSQGTVRNLVPLRELVPRSSSLKVITELPAAVFASDAGQFLAGPLVVRASHGLGPVTSLAVPLNQEPLLTWDPDSQAELAVKLLDVVPPWDNTVAEAASQRQDSELNPTGVSDFQSQLVRTLDTYPNIIPASNWSVMGALLALIMLVGPLDYIIVHRILQRPHWTWVTLPILVLGFGCLLLKLSAAGNSHVMTAQQIEVLDLDASHGLLRSHSWLCFYSPQTRRYNINVAPLEGALTESGTFSRSPQLGWLERPESGYRGMYRGSGLDLGKTRYALLADRQHLERYPLHIYSSGGVDCEWERREVEATKLITSDLTLTRGNQLTGTFTHQFPGELENWFIACRGMACVPLNKSPLRPGDTFDISQSPNINLEYMLLGQIEKHQYYDPLSNDVDQMIRIMSFHDAVGGSKYSRLHHAALGALDCSRPAKLDRAVLFGRLASPVTHYEIDGAAAPVAATATYIRVMLPFLPPSSEGSAPPPADILRAP